MKQPKKMSHSNSMKRIQEVNEGDKNQAALTLEQSYLMQPNVVQSQSILP